MAEATKRVRICAAPGHGAGTLALQPRTETSACASVAFRHTHGPIELERSPRAVRAVLMALKHGIDPAQFCQSQPHRAESPRDNRVGAAPAAARAYRRSRSRRPRRSPLIAPQPASRRGPGRLGDPRRLMRLLCGRRSALKRTNTSWKLVVSEELVYPILSAVFFRGARRRMLAEPPAEGLAKRPQPSFPAFIDLVGLGMLWSIPVLVDWPPLIAQNGHSARQWALIDTSAPGRRWR